MGNTSFHFKYLDDHWSRVKEPDQLKTWGQDETSWRFFFASTNPYFLKMILLLTCADCSIFKVPEYMLQDSCFLFLEIQTVMKWILVHDCEIKLQFTERLLTKAWTKGTASTFQSHLQVKENEAVGGVFTWNVVGFNIHLSVNPSKTLLTMMGKLLAFQLRNLDRQPLNQMNKTNVSCNGTNWYQLTNAHIITAGIVLTKNNDNGKQKKPLI